MKTTTVPTPIRPLNPARCIAVTKIAVMALVGVLVDPSLAAEPSLESAPPVVVKTFPAAGAMNVDPALSEIRVTFSKPMQEGGGTGTASGKENAPESGGKPHYQDSGRTCVLPVKLKPDTPYALWLNTGEVQDFKDRGGRPAVPYLLTFRTATAAAAGDGTGKTGSDSGPDDRLNDDQRAVLAWTNRQFGGYFDRRTFAGWTDAERAKLEIRLIDALNGPRTREYYQAINTLAALRSTNALPRLREIAFERVDRNNRDRWMAIRAIGLIGDESAVPEMIHLVYHGNLNTHWWAQISLVRLTGQNFGRDWNAWGQWWNQQGGRPPYNPEIIRWWNGQPEPDQLARSLEESDRKFLDGLNR